MSLFTTFLRISITFLYSISWVIPSIHEVDSGSHLPTLRIQFSEARLNGINSVIIPIEFIGRLIGIKTEIGEESGFLILDTGANGLVLNSRHFEASSRNSSLSAGIGGTIRESGSRWVTEFYAAEMGFYNIRGQAIELGFIEDEKKQKVLGLLGFEVLRDFEIQLHYQQRMITLSRLDKKGNQLEASKHTLDKVDSLSFELCKGLPVFKVGIGDRTKKVGLDTGAEYNLLNLKSIKDIKDQIKILKRIQLTGADGDPQYALGARLYRVNIMEGKYKCASMATALTGFNHINKIYQTRLDGILGYEFIAPWKMSINYVKKKLYIHKLRYNAP